MRIRSKMWLGLTALLACGLRAQAEDVFNAGPLFDRFPLTLFPGQRAEALGPFFYAEEKDGQKTWGIPPVWTLVKDPETDFTEYDFLYPLLTYDRFGTEYRWQFFQLLSFAGGENQEQEDAKRFTLFPIYFQQRSEASNENYTAVIPIYGRLKKRLLRDEIFFVMFPIYGQSRKKDVVTDNYLYPFFHLRHGEELSGWQAWPLLGHEHKGITYKTNGFGDVAVVGGHDKWFVLWPIFFNQTTAIGTENPQRSQAVLPLYSYSRSPNKNVTSIIWPFFSYITDREKKYNEWQGPWPIVVIARGEGKNTTRVWPLFSTAKSEFLESSFFLWPIYKYNRVHAEALDRSRTRILFFLYSDIVQKNVQTGAAQRRIDAWPLFTYRRDYNGSSRLQILSILEPLLPNSKSIERNYSPVWSIWRSEKNPRTGDSSHSLLWNLYRRETVSRSRKNSLLFGLFQYQSGPEGSRLRLLYIPVARTKPGAAPEPDSADEPARLPSSESGPK